jgi:LysM repeat protein
MGETLESIAKQYHTSVSEIQEVNDLQHSYLTLDQFLVIPVDRKVFENTLLGATK